MFLYEYQIRDRINRVKEYAENLRTKFDGGCPAAELLIDAKNLRALFDDLRSQLPSEVRDASAMRRHLGWMERRLKEENIGSCKGDIEDICLQDLPDLERAFLAWCASAVHYDDELVKKVSGLLLHREYDSAIRKGFVVLKERLCSTYQMDRRLDGQDLVNSIFGSTGSTTPTLSNKERQALRDLLAGLYGLFRNKYGHEDVESAWHEADAVLSMINTLLKRLC